MKILILLITVLSLTSCGLFRKSVKTSSSSEQVIKTEVKSETKELIKAVVEGESRVVNNEQKQVQKDINENITLTADEIEVKPNGSIKGKGNAKLLNNRKYKSKSDQNKTVDSSSRYVGHIDASKETKEQQKQGNMSEVKNKKSQSDPKGSMMIWGAIGLLILICGLFLFIRLNMRL